MQQFELARDGNVWAWGLHRGQVGGWGLRPLDCHTAGLRTSAGNLPRRMGGDFQGRDGDLIGKRVARLLPGHGPYTHALIDVLRGLFHQSFFQGDRIAHFVLKVEVSIVDLLPQRLAEDALQTGGVHAIFVVKELRWPGKGLRHDGSFMKT